MTLPSPGGPLRLRPEGAGDEAFLLGLFRDGLPAAWAALPLPAPARAALVRQQFLARAAGHRAHHPDGEFRVVERDGVPVGRRAVAWAPEGIHLVDLALLPAWRGRGLGAALLAPLILAARESGRPLTLEVDAANAPALRLYARLGFAAVRAAGPDLLMRREPA
ncbi:Mycothiol acetyltransferase [Methylobacterium crusticola]|uniref:Mycothiol acetyltransferase n=1 Tax=Methylobacterium crusticola TaxID=1697972 RepID=A0ABQ4QSY0_9HYPH|nr:GNAT family N-acetyltransferase [Methylobacterium crusticola]GJD48287.1 Mycothiol acetyltransferase [Methylobacterium crusticola]